MRKEPSRFQEQMMLKQMMALVSVGYLRDGKGQYLPETVIMTIQEARKGRPVSLLLTVDQDPNARLNRETAEREIERFRHELLGMSESEVEVFAIEAHIIHEGSDAAVSYRVDVTWDLILPPKK